VYETRTASSSQQLRTCSIALLSNGGCIVRKGLAPPRYGLMLNLLPLLSAETVLGAVHPTNVEGFRDGKCSGDMPQYPIFEEPS
jgi:hypothetical protein